MSALLLSWLRSTAQLPRSVECLERDLSNGYLLGHILSSLELEAAPESYADSANLASVLLNFERLEKSLHGVGIRLAPDTARNIMMEKKGAVAKLLMQLKEHVDRKEASRPQRIEPATASLRPPPDGSHRHMPAPDMTSPRDRFVENIIASIDPSDWNNHNRVDMAIHLRKFTEFMWSASDATAAHFASEHDHKLAAARRTRDDELTHTHEKQAFLEQWSAMGRDKWAANQAVKRNREAEQLQFELSLRERRRVIIAHANEAAAMDLADGVSSFDKNFKRLGISSGDDDTGVRLTPAKGSGLDHLVELETRVESFHLRPSSNIQMMKELRDRRKLHLNAQRERASRRRKMLVDQTRNTIEINRKQEEAALLHRLFIVGKRRRSANVAATERVIAYAAMIEAAAATSLGELHVAAMAPDAVARRAETLRAAVDEARVHDERKLEAHTLLCSDVLDTLLSFVHTVVVHR
ncbi:hypothetical protein SPRG_14126 [Saprolegnia parasitica CBS 223.65]|uniref:Calponin-homology (CH) domain-containing protein n=1 Tax=Saprolegnia parasitica (strain CBS 223.65) TaxID=695850 RepID=A0A067BVM5_SAPPC|nr:hypothetical protein SPRG_14126 [Saprolegnia parasitica CBS 223.65]KDO20895.1 hypothetical protein SPRG_14126 [Saprolegnia parasitica CBS 223.65]|eukprot:XP_012208384.1 hypothetical protein SPRG_14126 [Saprolegnia parasitica CBS 223.65]